MFVFGPVVFKDLTTACICDSFLGGREKIWKIRPHGASRRDNAGRGHEVGEVWDLEDVLQLLGVLGVFC